MAKIRLTIKAKQLFGQSMMAKVAHISLLKSNLGVGEKIHTLLDGAYAGHIMYVPLSFAAQTSDTFFKTNNSVATNNPLLFSIAGGETPKELNLWMAKGGGSDDLKHGIAIQPLGYSLQSVDTGLMVQEIKIEVKGDGEA